MQDDGNLVVFNQDNHVIWTSATHGNYGAFAQIHDDGNMSITRTNGTVIWETGTEVESVPMSPNEFILEATVELATVTNRRYAGLWGDHSWYKLWAYDWNIKQHAKFFAEEEYSYKITPYLKYRDYRFSAGHHLHHDATFTNSPDNYVTNKHNEWVQINHDLMIDHPFKYWGPDAPSDVIAIEESPIIWDYLIIEAIRN